MVRDARNWDRRTVLQGLGAAGLGLAGVGTATGSSGRGDVVPKGQARTVAENKVAQVAGSRKFASWTGATLGEPTTFYARNGSSGPDYVPAAYAFAVKSGGEDVGYVTTAARSDWAPVLEYSTATPPHRLAGDAADAAASNGVGTTGRLLYHGGVKYGVELDDGRAVNVRNGRPAEVRADFDPAGMSFDREKVERDWDALGSEAESTTTDDSVSTSDVTASYSFDSLWDVPAWTEHDDGGADYTLYGTGADSWDEWDGCVPVAASMIVAYHEGVTEDEDWTREWYIDELHDDMNTNDAGSTFPTDIDNGFHNFEEGSKSYGATNIYLWSHPNFTKSEITDNERPFLLNMTSGGTAQDRNQSYGDHTTTVVGYASDGEELELHDTWDDSYHYLTWGSWSACSYTKVTTS